MVMKQVKNAIITVHYITFAFNIVDPSIESKTYPAEYWADKFTAVTVGDIAVIYQPSSTRSKSCARVK
jgi:hypothetical protein